MTPKERAFRAQELLRDQVIQETITAMQDQAVEDFLAASKWWWGDRRRRIAAEHLREVRDFRARLKRVAESAPKQEEKMRYIA